MKKMAIVFFLVLFFAGCAGSVAIKNANLTTTNSMAENKVEMLIEPYQSLGVKLTPTIESGKATIVQGIFPEILFGEYFPGRIRWNAWAVDENGREYFGQAVFCGIGYSGEFIETLVFDEIPDKSAKTIVLSTAVEFGYDLSGNEVEIFREKFLKEPAYRKEFILSKGTKISDMRKVPDFLEIMKNWNRFQDLEKNEILLSPIGEKELKEIAGINPRYGFSEKLIGSGRFAMVMDPIGTGIGLALDVIRASGVPSTGWDYNSEIPSRRNMAFIVKYITAMQKQLIQNINAVNIQLVQER